jgi:phosphoribosyl-dephospho-CoA transferase
MSKNKRKVSPLEKEKTRKKMNNKTRETPTEIIQDNMKQETTKITLEKGQDMGRLMDLDQLLMPPVETTLKLT